MVFLFSLGLADRSLGEQSHTPKLHTGVLAETPFPVRFVHFPDRLVSPPMCIRDSRGTHLSSCGVARTGEDAPRPAGV
jgi:hypothetical protein